MRVLQHKLHGATWLVTAINAVVQSDWNQNLQDKKQRKSLEELLECSLMEPKTIVQVALSKNWHERMLKFNISPILSVTPLNGVIRQRKKRCVTCLDALVNSPPSKVFRGVRSVRRTRRMTE